MKDKVLETQYLLSAESNSLAHEGCQAAFLAGVSEGLNLRETEIDKLKEEIAALKS